MWEATIIYAWFDFVNLFVGMFIVHKSPFLREFLEAFLLLKSTKVESESLD
jgi:hypothetical protein